MKKKTSNYFIYLAILIVLWILTNIINILFRLEIGIRGLFWSGFILIAGFSFLFWYPIKIKSLPEKKDEFWKTFDKKLNFQLGMFTISMIISIISVGYINTFYNFDFLIISTLVPLLISLPWLILFRNDIRDILDVFLLAIRNRDTL